MNVSIIVAVTADGYIGRGVDQSSLEWTSAEDKRFFVEKTKEIGTVIVGRTTFETFARPLPNRRNIVLTGEPERYAGVEGAEFTSESPGVLLERLKSEGVERVAVIGGARVYSQFLTEGLVTDMYLTVEPIVFGGGIKFLELEHPIQLELVEQYPLNNETMLLHYSVSGR